WTLSMYIIFFFIVRSTTSALASYTLSLHVALPILSRQPSRRARGERAVSHRRPSPFVASSLVSPPTRGCGRQGGGDEGGRPPMRDRKSTRLNSSHDQISYAVFFLENKNFNANVFAT